MLRQLWKDDGGAILAAELVFIGSILVVGMVVGLTSVQSAVTGELVDLAQAVGALNQSYQTSGFKTTKLDGSIKATTKGSVYRDFIDDCDNQTCAPINVCEPSPEPPKP